MTPLKKVLSLNVWVNVTRPPYSGLLKYYLLDFHSFVSWTADVIGVSINKTRATTVKNDITLL